MNLRLIWRDYCEFVTEMFPSRQRDSLAWRGHVPLLWMARRYPQRGVRYFASEALSGKSKLLAKEESNDARGRANGKLTRKVTTGREPLKGAG